MKLRIVITPDGKIGLFSEEGTFETGSAVLQQITAALAADGIPIATQSEPEQHRHDDDGSKVHRHVDQHL